ncbi:tyrosine-type recombinase/integrase [Kordiimonas lipolytica]|uniref:Tyrosine-type recombinase/integrase n=1 Tax=Kordiimonas lipolytica TaxID=1662421 RepID=A0ABV8U6I2_9PROT|nr:tyrosine-type recombinase/integrase [Kordiimonas lipolytica]
MLTVTQRIAERFETTKDQLKKNRHAQTICMNQIEIFKCPAAQENLAKLMGLESTLKADLNALRTSYIQVQNYVRYYSPFKAEFDDIVREAGFQLGHFPYTVVREGATEEEIEEAVANFENLAWARARGADVQITQCSNETIWRYIRCVVKGARKSNLRDFINQVITRTDQTRATFRWTRAAINFFLEMLMVCDRACEEIYDLHNMLNSVNAGKLPKKHQKQTYIRRKSVPEKTYPLFEDTLMSLGSDGLTAAMIFKSTIFLGLRPIEWQSACLDEDEPRVLIVKNAKYSNGRACGEYRYLHLLNFDDAAYQLIRATIDVIRMELEDTTFVVFMERIRRAFRQAHQKMSPKAKKRRITLYTARHQFAANMKRYWGLDGRDALGALMGHSNDNTAGCHYAHTNQAMKGGSFGPTADGTNVPLPDQSNIAQVRITNCHLRAMELGANNQCSQSADSPTSECTTCASNSMSK